MKADLNKIKQKIENAKQLLALQADFTLINGYNVLNLKNKGSIASEDFYECLKRCKSNVSENDAHVFFDKYTKAFGGCMNYIRYCSFVTPLEVEYADLLKSRKPRYEFADPLLYLSAETQKLFRELLEQYVEAENERRATAQKLAKDIHFNSQTAFTSLDAEMNKLITLKYVKTMQ